MIKMPFQKTTNLKNFNERQRGNWQGGKKTMNNGHIKMILYFIAGILFFISGIIGEQYPNIVLGFCFITLGISKRKGRL